MSATAASPLSAERARPSSPRHQGPDPSWTRVSWARGAAFTPGPAPPRRRAGAAAQHPADGCGCAADGCPRFTDGRPRPGGSGFQRRGASEIDRDAQAERGVAQLGAQGQRPELIQHAGAAHEHEPAVAAGVADPDVVRPTAEGEAQAEPRIGCEFLAEPQIPDDARRETKL